MFLTPADLHDLTGYRLGAWQARWLTAHGWIFERDAFGRPRVLRAYAEGRLGLAKAVTDLVEQGRKASELTGHRNEATPARVYDRRRVRKADAVR